MNKKKKQKIVRYSIAASVVVLFVIAIIVSIVTKDLEAKQFEQKRNTDVMEFNPLLKTSEDWIIVFWSTEKYYPNICQPDILYTRAIHWNCEEWTIYQRSQP